MDTPAPEAWLYDAIIHIAARSQPRLPRHRRAAGLGDQCGNVLAGREAVYHGQGYANSGYLWPDDPADERLAGLGMTLPSTYELTFDTAGEQPYYCVIHGDPVTRQGMIGIITVA